MLSRMRAKFVRHSKISSAHVGVGSKADVTLLNFDVCFTPESGHPSAATAMSASGQ